jgi:hypothetical protein
MVGPTKKVVAEVASLLMGAHSAKGLSRNYYDDFWYQARPPVN